MGVVAFQNVVGREVAAPVALGRRRRRLSSIVRRHGDHGRPLIVSVHRRGEALAATEESIRLRSEWARTLVGPDDLVLVTYLPMGGGGSNATKQIGTAIAAIALAVIAPYAVGALGAAGIGGLVAGGSLTLIGQALSAGIIVGGSMLLGLASRPKANNPDRQIYGVSGGGNVPRAGDRIPVLYGKYWVTPDLSQQDWAIYDGEDQILFKRMTVTLGKARIYELKLGSSTFWTAEDGVAPQFPGSEVELITPGEPSELVPGDVVTSGDVAGLGLPLTDDDEPWAGPYIVSPTDVEVSRLQIDISYPDGLYYQTDEGDINARDSSVTFQYRQIDAADEPIGAWVTYNSAGRMKSQKPVRKTFMIDVALGRYEVRGRRNYEDSNRPGFRATWDALRGHTPDVRTRDYVTEIGIKLRSSKTLGTISLSDMTVLACRILPVWNSETGEWEEVETRKAVWAYADIMRNQSYGGALPDARLDVATLEHYASTVAEFDTFDGVIRGPDAVYGVAATVLGVMRAEPSYSGRIWSLTRDEPKAVPAHVISARQMVKGSTSVSYQVAGPEGSADVIVEYDRGGDPKLVDELRVTYGQPSLTPQRRRLTGVSSYHHAMHLGRWIAASGYYRRKIVAGTVEHEGRIYARGDKAKVPVFYLAGPIAAGIEAYDDLEFALDRDLVVNAGDYAVLRRRDGLEWGPVGIAQGADTRTIILDADDVAAVGSASGLDLDEVLAGPAEDPTTLVIGQLAEQSETYLIKTVMPSAANRSDITAVNDHSGVWTAIGATMPPVPLPPSAVTLPERPEVPWVRAHVTQSQAAVTLYYQIGAAPGAVEYRVEMAYSDPAEDYEPEWQRIDPGGPWLYGTAPVQHDQTLPEVRVRAWAVGATGLSGPIVETTAETRPLELPPATVGDDTITVEKFTQGLRDYVTNYLSGQATEIAAVAQRLAALVAEQDAGNYIEQQTLRRELRVKIGQVVAGYTEAISVAVGPDSAVAQAITEIYAAIGNVEANLNVRYVASVTPEGALAAFEAVAKVSGDQDAQAGLHVVAFDDGAGGARGEVWIEADRLMVGRAVDGVYTPMFTIITSPTPRVVLNGDFIAAGSITAAKLNVGELSAIAASLGDITAGRAHSEDNTLDIDFDNARIVISDDEV